MAENKSTGRGEGLSLQTLVIAAAASAVAAIVVSHVWKGGTVIAAAMTPVIVSIVKELLARPIESEIVRKPVQQVGRIASSKLTVPVRPRTATRGGGEPVLPPTEQHDDAGPPADGEITPMRTYGRMRRRPVHLKIALITGLVGFLIAAAALTLPELIFGGAISSHHDTTLFGGGSTSTNKKNTNGTSTTQQQQSKPGSSQTTPTKPPPTSGGSKPSTTPAPTSPQKSPQQTTPQQTTPVPTAPTTPAP
jgi:uncharacterized membrane protein YvlD (DUF360 family)